MLDARARALLAPPLERAGRALAAVGVHPTAVTAAAWCAGIGACTATAMRWWGVALVLWLANRLLDGLDGPVARATGATDRGGFLDIVADFSVYAGVVVGLAVALPGTRLACVVLLATYYASGTAFLALSSLVERRRQVLGDDRSLRFVGGLAEGTETVAVYVLLFLLPRYAELIIWTFAAAVGITAVQRTVAGVRLLTPLPQPIADP